MTNGKQMKTITNILYPAIAVFALTCFGISPASRAVVPPPDGGYPNFTTAEGDNALRSLTTGVGNTAIGTFSLSSVTTGSFNTANGLQTLMNNTEGDGNTGTGFEALQNNTIGNSNTANGS